MYIYFLFYIYIYIIHIYICIYIFYFIYIYIYIYISEIIAQIQPKFTNDELMEKAYLEFFVFSN